MHLSAALQYSWEKGSVNAKQCVAPISMPGFRLLGLEPRSRFTIVRDLTQSGWRATRLRRGGALTRRRSEAPQIGLYARPGELRPPGRGRPGLRQYVSIVVNDFPYARGPCPFKTQRVRAALRFFHQQNFFHSVCLRELYLDYLIHGGVDVAAHE